MATPGLSPPPRGPTARFRAKRDAIVAAAAEVINEQSAKGLTFADVADRVGLNTTSITYYFKRKDDLAAACFAQTMSVYAGMLADAAAEGDVARRVARFVALQFDRLTAEAEGHAPALAGLSDIRAMEEPMRAPLLAQWLTLFRDTRRMLDPVSDPAGRALATARAHILLENVMWLSAWLRRYQVDEFPRVRDRLTDVLINGIAPPGARWAPVLQALPSEGEHDSGPGFLTAATRLINERGYRGASVQRIASQLNVTKGSFYHHLDAKDDLVLACFRRSFAVISAVQRAADRAGGDQWQRLGSVLATLLDIQFSDTGPLLRTSALTALPPRVRGAMIDRSNGVARRFAGMLSDGIAEGSIRAVDPLIAAQAIMASQNAAYDLRNWAAKLDRDQAIAAYAGATCFGLCDPA